MLSYPNICVVLSSQLSRFETRQGWDAAKGMTSWSQNLTSTGRNKWNDKLVSKLTRSLRSRE